MKRDLIRAVVQFVIALGCSTGAWGETGYNNRTLAPYFRASSDTPGIEGLPLRSTSVSANIAGVIADVTVTQTYRNEGRTAIEAVYVFPGSTRAAVHALSMTIGDRTIRAKIREREKARAEYEAARESGRTASLLEQERPNVFTMNVANIMPGDEIRVVLEYTEYVPAVEGMYEFVFPTVVGPRYSNMASGEAKPTDNFVASPYQKQGEAPLSTFDLNVHVAAGMPIQEITSPSHKIAVGYENLADADVRLDSAETRSDNRDFILRYRLAGDKVQSGLLLSRSDAGNYFLTMMEPPRRVSPEQIPPREYLFVIDVSGSMAGFPLETTKSLMRGLLVNLKEKDLFNVLFFAGDAQVLAEQPVAASRDNIDRAMKMIGNLSGGGATELLPALERGLALPRTPGVSRSVVIVTDGYICVEKQAFDLIRRLRGDANVFTFGIGSSVNRHLIEGLARAGFGEPFVVTGPEEAAAASDRFRKYIETPVLTDIRVSFPSFGAYEVSPVTVPDLFAARPVAIHGKWRGALQGEIVITGRAGGEWYRWTAKPAEHAASGRNAALEFLWARQRIAELDDDIQLDADDTRIAEVTRLGLEHGLLTQYTSFVAVDEIVRRDSEGRLVTVEQPLPLPAGVENTAVGCEIGSMTTMIATVSSTPIEKGFSLAGLMLLLVVAPYLAGPALARKRVRK